jgi:anti-sigma factor ChrR (cupin superfamily)
MLSAQKDLYVSARNAGWAPFGEGIKFRLLRISPETGTWTVLLSCAPGSSIARHRHLAAGEYFVVSGVMELRGGEQGGGVTARTGDYGWEPVSIVHDNTYFPEQTELFFTNHGAVLFMDEQDQTTLVLDWEAIQKLALDAH